MPCGFIRGSVPARNLAPQSRKERRMPPRHASKLTLILSIILIIFLQNVRTVVLAGPEAVPEPVLTAPQTRVDKLVAEAQKFIEEAEEQHTADPVFRAKIAASLKRALAVCPPDFTNIVNEFHDLAAEVSDAQAALPSLRKEHALAARLYSSAYKHHRNDEARELLSKLSEITERLMHAEGAASAVHPLRLQFFKTLFQDYYGKTCPQNSAFLDGSFCIDLFEAPNVPGKTPTGGFSYLAAEDICKKAGKRLCTGDEWLRACLGPVCRPNGPAMNPFDAEWCNPSLDIRSDRPLKPAGEAKNCITPEGIADLYGNAWEWVDEDYKTYYKIVRGGAGFRERAPSCSSAAWAMPDVAQPYYGVRCCADPAVQPPAPEVSLPLPPESLPAATPNAVETPITAPEPEPLPTEYNPNSAPRIQPSPGFQ